MSGGGSLFCNETGLSARDKLVKELLDTEAGHVASLELFVSEYVVPLRVASDVVGHDDVVMMASNVELLLSWNQQFLHALKKCLKKDLTRPFAQVERFFWHECSLTGLCSGVVAHGAHAAPAVHSILRKLRARLGDL
jgi:hypothetical protein